MNGDARGTGEPDDGACSGSESFALQVIGRDMSPEFDDGDIIIVEPEGAVEDGSFVLARHEGEWLLRQLRRDGAGWRLRALDAGCTHCGDVPLPDLTAVRGVVIQKAVPGRRRLGKRYV